jgi:hypothetical protein
MTVISENNISMIIAYGGLKPVILSNGYAASLSIDVIREDVKMLHLSVSNAKEENTDIDIAKSIAHDIFGGDEFYTLGVIYVRNVIHFVKKIEGNMYNAQNLSGIVERDVDGNKGRTT